MIRKYVEIFCLKNVSSFCSAKATHIFSANNIRILFLESAKTVNEMTLNELVKLTTLWTTGPWPFLILTLTGFLCSICEVLSYRVREPVKYWRTQRRCLKFNEGGSFMMRRLTGDQEVAGSTPAEVGNILSWKLIMKYFLRSFSPFPLIQEGQLSVSGERMCTILVNRLED